MARRSRSPRRRLPGRLRGRYGRFARWIVVLGVLVAAIAETRQSALFYPLDQPFDRALYGHWIDGDGDCQDTRTEVLVQESLEPPTLDARGCTVIAGHWYDPFTDQTITEPRALDVDHRVPLAEAHRSGAHRWDATRRQAFANDLSHPDTLIAVALEANRSKGDRDPLSWLPSAWGYRCAYTARWRATKQRWALEEDLLEGLWIDTVLGVCRLTG